MTRTPTDAFKEAALEHARSRGAKSTRETYAYDLQTWIDYCAITQADPTKPTLTVATAFRDLLLKTRKGLSVRRTLSALSSMYQAAVDREKPLARWNPFRKLPRPSSDLFSQTEAISDTDVRKIIEKAKDDTRDSAVLRLLYDTGLRCSSVAALVRADVVMRGETTVLRVIVKGSKRRETELPEITARALQLWIALLDRREESSPWLFPSARGEGHMHPTSINKMVAHYGKLACVDHVHPHRFRASYVTSALDAGIPLHEVQASVHHSSPVTTQRYDRGVRGGGVTDAVAKFRSEKK